MKKNLRFYLLAGLVLTVDFTVAGPSNQDDQMGQKPIINLYVYNYARVPESTLEEAENQVTKIFTK